MSNTIGKHLRLTTFGESHGAAVGGILDGCPAGIAVDEQLIANEMERRHEGGYATSRREPDVVEILSGTYQGLTLGTPIAFIVRNSDTRSEDYSELAGLYRPGHADFTYDRRYGLRDPRGGGRASGRETAARVAAGAIAKMILNQSGISVKATVAESATPSDNDSCGGIVECTVSGLKAGYGNPVFDKLNARLAAAAMSIPSAIGFEMGAGFEAARMTGSQPVVFRVAFHPPVTINQPTVCIDRDGKLHSWIPQGRHDRCHIDRTVVVVEAMAALTVADYIV